MFRKGYTVVPCWGLGGVGSKPQVDAADLSTSLPSPGLATACSAELRTEVDLPMEQVSLDHCEYGVG